jgi:predicted dehydrogenase
MSLTRRHFIRRASALGLTALTLNAHAGHGLVREKIRVGVAGFGGRGRALIEAVRAVPQMQLVALCDVDAGILAGLEPENGDLIRTGKLDEFLGRDDIDAVVSATPNHWHALLTMRACAAGKHVYIEKPVSHNVHESIAMVAMAKATNRCVQGGFQNRSDSALRPFYERLLAGEFGKVLAVHGTCHRPRDPIGRLDQPLQVLPEIDYDQWLGPAEDQPLWRPKLHYDWHWDFNTGNGDVGNQGPHEWDLMNWALGDQSELPQSIIAAGNRFGWNDAGNTPNVMACAGTTADGIPFSFEVMDLRDGGPAPDNVGVGVIIETEAGRFAGGRGGGRFIFNDGRELKFDPDPAEPHSDTTFTHMQNFADAVLAADPGLLRSEIGTAARSSSWAHFANIAYRTGEAVEIEAVRAAFDGADRSRDMIGRLIQAPQEFGSRHQREVREGWRLGRQLRFDSLKQEFSGPACEAGNQLLGRKNRPGFGLPAVTDSARAGS